MPEAKLFISASCVLSPGGAAVTEIRRWQNPIWTICSHLKVVQELEIIGPGSSLVHSPRKLCAATSALSPVVTRHGVRRPALFC